MNEQSKVSGILPMLGIGVFLFLFGFLSLRPLDDGDFFAYFVLGRERLLGDLFDIGICLTYPICGSAQNQIGWLGQIAFAEIFGFFGFRGVHLIHALVFAFVLSMPFFIRGRCKYSDALAVLVAFIVAASETSARLQIFSVLSVSLFFWMTRGRKTVSASEAAALLLVALVWQNFHPALILGIIIVTCRFATLCIRRRELTQASAAQWILLIIALGLLQFATPLGIRMIELSRLNEIVSRDIVHVSEWMHPWHPSVWDALIPFWVISVFTLIGVFQSKERNLEDVLVSGVFFLLTLYAARFAVFWALVTIPIWSSLIEEFLVSRRRKTFSQLEPATIIGLAFLGAVSLGLSLARSPVTEDFPITEIREVSTEIPHARVFNYREWGGVTELATEGRWLVAYDGALGKYSNDDWQTYLGVARGEIPIKEIERRFAPDVLLLHPELHRDFITNVLDSKCWRKRSEHIFVKYESCK